MEVYDSFNFEGYIDIESGLMFPEIGSYSDVFGILIAQK